MLDETWTLSALIAEAAAHIAALPPPRNGQIRAVPDERTFRYYVALGLIDKPVGQRGRRALYGRRHLAQLVSIKRMQAADRSLAEIRRFWPTLDDYTLERMSGIALVRKAKPPAGRPGFWKHELAPTPPLDGAAAHTLDVPALPAQRATPAEPAAAAAPAAVRRRLEVRVELAPEVTLALGVADDAAVSLAPGDVRALRAAAAPLIAELARRGLVAKDIEDLARDSGTLEEEP